MRPSTLVILLASGPWLAATAGAQTCPTAVEIVPGNGSSSPQSLTNAFGNRVFFSAQTQALGSEPYVWSPTTGATLLKDIRPGSTGSSPEGFTPCCLPIGGRVFFSAFDPNLGKELHMTDGTAAGTTVVKDIRSGFGSSHPGRLTAAGDRLFFTADDGVHGIELWRTDGTAAGTVLVKDIVPGSASSIPDGFAFLDGKVFFTAFTPASGRELWVSDGTAAGTVMLTDIGPGSASASVSEITPCGHKVFFHAYETTLGGELYASDGTAAGTGLVKDINSNSGSASPTDLTSWNGILYFAATDRLAGRELFRSDGTAAGTTLLKDVRAGSLGSNPQEFTVSNGRLFFRGYGSGVEGTELWVSDGTTAGTALVKDILPGGGSSAPSTFAATGAGVLFAATSANGHEVWFSDGTAAGTVTVCDLYPGANSSTPRFITTCAGHGLFTASIPATGNELFWIPKAGAGARGLGHGGAPDYPTLTVDRSPVLGTTVRLQGEGPATYTGFLLLGPSLLAPLPAIPPLTQGGCDWVGAFTSALIVTATAPPLSLPVQVPNQPSLNGAAVNLQVWWVNGNGSPPFQVSNGLQLVAGLAAPQ